MPSAGSDQDLDVLVQGLGPALVLYARTWAGRDEAEDVVQRVFVRLFLIKRWPAEPRSWLFRCVRNEAISFRRSLRRRMLRQHKAMETAQTVFEHHAGDMLELDEAQEALAKLPSLQREIVVLRIWSGLTLAQASTVTGLPVSTLHDQYYAALSAIRVRLEQSWKTQNR